MEENIPMAEKVKTTSTSTKQRKPAAKKTAAAPKKAEVTTIAVSREEIARLAHRIWAERGHQHGRAEEDWLRAEELLRGKAS